MKTSGIIYYHDWHAPHASQNSRPTHSRPQAHPTSRAKAGLLAIGLIAISLGGMIGPEIPAIRLESHYKIMQTRGAIASLRRYLTKKQPVATQQPASSPIKPVVFTPLTTPDGSSIDPIDTDFGLVIPKIGVNAKIIPAVNPTKPGEYLDALQKGIAHSSLSYFPDEDGTVYLFSHSTNYDWFVKDLNAAFYLLKNLEIDDRVVLFYKGRQYEYQITNKQVVAPTAVNYLVPEAGAKRLILQTCWPPGSTTERLLLFADFVPPQTEAI